MKRKQIEIKGDKRRNHFGSLRGTETVKSGERLWLLLVPAPKTWNRIGLLFTHKTPISDRYCAASVLKVNRHILDKLS